MSKLLKCIKNYKKKRSKLFNTIQNYEKEFKIIQILRNIKNY